MATPSLTTAHGVELSCGVQGLRLISHPPSQLPSFEFTTGVFIDTPTVSSLCRFFSERISDPTVALCLDAPGMGKTTTVERAAYLSSAVYIRFSAQGIMKSALHRSRELLEEAAAKNASNASTSASSGKVDGADAERIALAVWKLALVACMDRCREGLVKKRCMLGLCDGNGVNFAIEAGDVQQTFNDSRAALLSAVRSGASSCGGGDWSEEATIAFHFDEIQCILPELREHIRHRRAPLPASPAECMQYSLVWFSSALFEMCVGGCIRPCLTGIGVDAVDSLRLDSSIKLWPLNPLPYFGDFFVKQVLAPFVIFEVPKDLETLVRGVAGCPRAVQHALLVIRVRAEAIVRGETLPTITCSELVVLAYASWRASGVSVFLRGENKHLRAAEEAFLCTCFPSAWNATAAAVDGIPVATMSASNVVQSWREAAHVGVLRLRITSNEATLFPPYPFLECYIRSLGPRRLALCDCIELVQRTRLFPTANGAMGRGKAFEFAVALELCLPGSALLRAILSCDQLVSLSLRPLAKDVLPLHKFDTAALGDVCEKVYIVSDGGATAKPGDIAVPVILSDNSLSWLIVEVKSSTAKDSNYVRHGQVAFTVKMSSEPLQRFLLSCYLPTRDTRSLGGTPVKADTALAEFNTPPATGSSQRHMGLVILNDDLLAACTLNLASVLRCEDFTQRSEAEWYKIVFSDAVTRASIAGELHTNASEVSESACRVPDSGLCSSSVGAIGSGCSSEGLGRGSVESVVGPKRRRSTSPDETALLRQENERLRREAEQAKQRERVHAEIIAELQKKQLELSHT